MSAGAVAPATLPFEHLARLTDARGVFEHADHDVPRREHGYCLDDVARALLVLVREPEPSPRVAELSETSLRFVEAAIDPFGRAHNRMDASGAWTDEATTDDWWGRAVGALGIAATSAPLPLTRARAMRAFLRAVSQHSVDVRTMAFAVPGAAAVLQARPGSEAARRLVATGLAIIPQGTAEWGWVEPRLRYGNASLVDALLAAGHVLSDHELVERALRRFDALLTIESRDGHLSVTGPDGRGLTDSGPQFDQQPIEVAAIADAAARAFHLTSDPRWRRVVGQARDWFLGDNDSGAMMVDVSTGAGFDGLERDGRNENRGAESTLAALSTFQQARAVGLPGRALASTGRR
ncbi:MAG TPA: glycosyltransferase [Pseudolysinimonas sp.]|nr:glycosyltransferase [Pseudolysinimonas sp.]